MAAIEALRQHQLAKVDAQLAEFGMEPPLPKTEEQTLNCFMQLRRTKPRSDMILL
jgi:hypothetical protein